jgi:hypothetical protein
MNQTDSTVNNTGTFTGLTPNTSYVFEQRVAATANTDASAWSPVATIKTASAPLTGTVVISGTPVFNGILTANVNGSNATTLSYQWLRGTTPISGATASTYTLAAADVGQAINVQVTSNGFGGSLAATPTAAVVKADQTTPVTVTLPNNGTAVVGLTGATATVAGGNGTGAYAYTSSDPSVATVDANGNITAVAAGTTKITAIRSGDGGYNDSAASAAVTLTVVPKVDTLVVTNTNATGDGLANAQNQGNVTFGSVTRDGATNNFSVTVTGTQRMTNYATVNPAQDAGNWVGALISYPGITDITQLYAKTSADGAYTQLTDDDVANAVYAGGTDSLVDWLNVTDSGTGSTNTIWVAQDANGTGAAQLTLNFVPYNAFALTVVAGTGGTVTGTTYGNYAPGALIPITAKPNSGYNFNGWTSSNGGSFGNSKSTSTTFTMPANNTKVTASFVYASGGTGGGGGSYFAPATASTTTTTTTTPTPTTTTTTTPTTGTSTGWQNPFSDVKSTDWFYSDVANVVGSGLFNGTSATAFSPQSPMTRGMFVTALWRLASSPASNGSSFTDVPQSAYYAQAVSWAASNGVVKGISSTLFAPNTKVTREQMASILYRYEQFSSKTPSNTAAAKKFADGSKIDSYAQSAVNALVQQGMLGGKPGNLFDPQGTATRAEVASMLHRFTTAS